MDFIKEWGMIAGFAGLALGTFLYLFNGVISKKIFPTLTKKQSFTLLMTIVSLVSLISALSIVLYFTYSQSSKQLTVFVTDTKGNVVLEHNGRINIPLGNRSLNEIIGVNGRINFPDITKDNIGDTIFIGLDAKGWEIADGKNTFVYNGDPIHLKVKMDNSLGIIKGVVKNRDGRGFIKGALVSINTDTAIWTDDLGIFKIVLPEHMQMKSTSRHYELTVSKEGYLTTSQYYFPNTHAEIRLIKQ